VLYELGLQHDGSREVLGGPRKFARFKPGWARARRVYWSSGAMMALIVRDFHDTARAFWCPPEQRNTAGLGAPRSILQLHIPSCTPES